MIKYSLLLAYIDRAPQFRNTLVSLAEHYGLRGDVELSIVEDVKNVDDEQAHLRFLDALNLLPDSIPVVLSIGGERGKIDPTPQYNQAFRQSSGEYVIMISSEILHLTDVLSEFDKIYDDDKDAYILVSCLHAVSCTSDIKNVAEFNYTHKKWYQHSIHRNAGRPFMSCISRKMWDALGGQNEAYKDGWGYGDDDWRNRLKLAGIKTTYLDSHPVVHQEHTKWTGHPQYREMIARNKAIYAERWPDA